MRSRHGNVTMPATASRPIEPALHVKPNRYPFVPQMLGEIGLIGQYDTVPVSANAWFAYHDVPWRNPLSGINVRAELKRKPA